MSGALTTTPARTQAAILRAVLGQKYPRLALPTIAANFKMQLVDLQAIINHHGYPETARMNAAAAALEHAATAPAAPTDQDPEASADGYLIRVPLGQLHADPDNGREHLDDIDDLASSIQEAGLLQPIVARKHQGRLVVVAGHRRLAAVRSLRWADVPVIIRSDIEPADVLAAMLIENGQRAGLDPIEEARAIEKMVADGNTTSEVARKIGRSTATVTSRLMLLQLPLEEQEQGLVRETNAQRRKRLNPVARPVGRPKGAKTKPYFGDTHPLADDARRRCDHRGTPKVGGVACGPCWESTIRTDQKEPA